ncbi:MAG: hypothetical protein V8Q84_03280 [Bilophila sp.]
MELNFLAAWSAARRKRGVRHPLSSERLPGCTDERVRRLGGSAGRPPAGPPRQVVLVHARHRAPRIRHCAGAAGLSPAATRNAAASMKSCCRSGQLHTKSDAVTPRL